MEPSIIETKQVAIDRMKAYLAAHPASPSAVRHPLLCKFGQMWTASLVSDPREGIAGVGPTVEAALTDFDAKYLGVLRPSEISEGRISSGRQAPAQSEKILMRLKRKGENFGARLL